MGISTTSARNYRMQQFTSSGTWTCPAGTDVVEVMLIGGGGGGGGGGAGACSTAGVNNNSINSYAWGGNGGGGGGAGEYVRRFIPVTPGTTYNITVGAGGLGGKTASGSLQPVILNFISNPGFENNTTGWTGVTGTFIRQTSIIARGSASAQITASGTTASWQFDTGQMTAAQVQTGRAPQTYFALRRASNASTANLNATLACYNASNALLDTLTTSFTGNISTTATTWLMYGFGWSNSIPSGTTRMVVTYTITGSATNEVFQLDLFQLVPSSDWIQNFGFYGEHPYYFDPSAGGSSAYSCWWAGTAQNSFTMGYDYLAGRGVSEVASPATAWLSSMAGLAGSGGGSTSFGSLAEARGGQGGGGGDSGSRRIAVTGTWAHLVRGRNFVTGTFANGGGFAAFGQTQYDPSNGGGGGSIAGWRWPFIRGRMSLDNNVLTVTDTVLPAYQVQGSIRGSAGMATGWDGNNRYATALTATVSSTTQYQAGGQGTPDGYCWGGGGGTAGGSYTWSTSYTATTNGAPRVSSDKDFWPSCNYGDGGAAGAPATTNGGIQGAGYNGSDGANGVTFGSGGGGGGGGGGSSNTSSNPQRGALSGNGGSGGDGANGVAMIMWWEG